MTTAKNNKSLNEWLLSLETKHSKSIDLGLDRIQKVYQRCQLDKIAPLILTVAGTNGKGSTVAILYSIIRNCGYKVGDFTSPHLLQFNERIKINGVNVPDESIIEAFEIIEQHTYDLTLSYFEYAALAAMIVFKKNHVDVAVLEVGLGGRLDAVNVVDTDCAIITTIDIDHTDWLGNDIESIAYEKAGIMRTGKPAIYGDDHCPQSIIDHAQKIGADLKFSDITIIDNFNRPNIKGHYQLKNAATALTALDSVSDLLDVSEQGINKGLQNIELLARLQTLSHNPEIIIDVSHNQQAATSLNQWIEDNPCKGKNIAVFAVLDDKNVIQWLNLFEHTIDVWCISSVKSERAMPTKNLLTILSDFATVITSFQSVKSAYKNAKIIASPDDRIIVFGSFYTVTEVMQVQ